MDENEVLEDSSPVVEETPVTESEPTETRDIIAQELEKAEAEQANPNSAQPPEPEAASEPDRPQRDPWKSWKKEAAAELSKLPSNVQNFIIERQEQFHRGIEQYKEAANYAKTIDKSIHQYKDYLNQLGVTPEVAFPNLLKTEHTLRMGNPQEKAEMLQKLAHDYGIDLGQLASMPYDAHLHQLKSQLDFTKAQLEASNSFRQGHEDAQIQGHIEDFAQGREYFEDVRLLMADLLDRGLATDLDDAYAKAVRMDENVFAKSQSKTRLTQADQAAKAARAAAVSVKGSPVGVKTQAAPTSTEDAVRMAMRQHGIL
jgi:hypothetical protein